MKRSLAIILTLAILSLMIPVTVSAATYYNADFTQASAGNVPSGYQVLSGSASMKKGYLEVGQNSAVRLPTNYKYTNFTMEVSFTIASANEQTRWASFMYRGQDANLTSYMQMCVRQGATAANGVEIAAKIGNEWKYNHCSSGYRDINSGIVHTAKIVANGNYITQYLDERLCCKTDAALLTSGGYFGLQTSGAVLRVYSIKISSATNNVAEATRSTLRSVYEPQTKLVAAPTVIERIDSLAKMQALGSTTPPQGAWFEVESLSKVNFASGSTTLKAALTACGNKVIPVLEVPNNDVASNVFTYLIQNGITDVIIACADRAALANIAKQRANFISLAYIASGDKARIAREAHEVGANICVLKKADRATIEYLQARFLTVTINTYDNSSTRTCVGSAIDSGANGVVVPKATEAYELYSRVTSTHYVRRPFTIGHRGYPAVAPENSLEGMKAAFAAGAQAVECDIWLTKDGHIVNNHNGNLAGYTTDPNATAAVSTLTRAQIKQYTLKPVGSYTNCKMPFLDEMFAVLKNYPDRVLVIELKTSDTNIVEKTRQLAEQYGVSDQLVFISFYSFQITVARSVMPHVGASLLADGGTTAETAISISTRECISFSPSASFTDTSIKMLYNRGISTNLWTLNDENSLRICAARGAQFLTTDTTGISNTVIASLPMASSVALWGADTTPPPTVSIPAVPNQSKPSNTSSNSGSSSSTPITAWGPPTTDLPPVNQTTGTTTSTTTGTTTGTVTSRPTTNNNTGNNNGYNNEDNYYTPSAGDGAGDNTIIGGGTNTNINANGNSNSQKKFPIWIIPIVITVLFIAGVIAIVIKKFPADENAGETGGEGANESASKTEGESAE